MHHHARLSNTNNQTKKLPNLKKTQSPYLWKLGRMLLLQQETPLLLVPNAPLMVSSSAQDLATVLKKQALSCWMLLFLLCFILNEWKKCWGFVFYALFTLIAQKVFSPSACNVLLLLPLQGNTFSVVWTGQSQYCPWVPLSKKQIMSYILRVFSSKGLQMCHGPISIPSCPSHSYD